MSIEVPCPWCGNTNDVHTAFDDPKATPSNNDVSLCMSCGQFSLFHVADDGTVHLDKPRGGLGYAHVVSVLQENMK